MKAVGYSKNLPINEKASLEDVEIEIPRDIGGHDLLVEVKGISVNPVDYKIRQSFDPKGQLKILGWDSSGIVKAVGTKVSLFKVGDEVFYAGDITRPGSQSEYHMVDERIVGRKPKTLSFEQAAALPLTSLTAWEVLFERLRVQDSKEERSILIMGGAGGVGSMAIQLARHLTLHKIIATASRPESIQWIKDLGAHHTIDHAQNLHDQLQAMGIESVDFILSSYDSAGYSDQFTKILSPQGAICLIDDPESFDIVPFKRKSISVHWELIFTRPMFKTLDLVRQHHILNEVSDLVDHGYIRTTANASFGNLNAANLKRAHAQLETGKAIGKMTLSVP